MQNNRPKIIDVFSGAGGLSLGAARAGFDVIGAVEKDAKASEIHRLNFPKTKMFGDAWELSGSQLLNALNVNRIDGLIGGPPCQGFSTIGRHAKDDSRNDLFVKFFKLVSEIRPKFFLAENVPGLMSDCYESMRNSAFELVSDYRMLPPLKLKASDFGVPTTRTRMFFIGFKESEVDTLGESCIDSLKVKTPVTVKEALYGLRNKVPHTWQTEEQSWRLILNYGTSEYADSIRNAVPDGVGNENAIQRLDREHRVSGFLGTEHTPQVIERFDALLPGEMDAPSKATRLDPLGFCPTLRAGTGKDRGSFQAVRPIHPTEPRVITPREAARLQGFPDWFVFHHTKWHSFRQIGNSVSPILAKKVLARVRQKL